MEQAVQSPSFRRFESARGAIALDFDLEATPQVVTSILAACAADVVTEEDLWALPVGTRIRYLLTIIGLEPEPTLWARRQCANDACGEPIEIDLTPAELIALAEEQAGTFATVATSRASFRVRKPTGRDQRAWQSREFDDESEALRALATDLVTTGAESVLGDGLVAIVEEALAELDPLVCLELSLACPYCHEVRRYEFDPLALVLVRFRDLQERLVDDVHALASHYHWAETEILAVPAARRARYLELIELGSA